MKKILLTGFMPFGGETVNPSWLAVEKCKIPSGCTVIKRELPVSYLKARELLEQWMDEISPDYVVCVGQAGGRKAVTPERVAVNLMDASVPDNDGFLAQDLPVCENGPDAYFATLPVKKMVQHMRGQGLTAAPSLSAGSYVCNCVMYTALHHAKVHNMPCGCGFIHVPYIPEQTAGKDVPSMPLEDIAKALEVALETLTQDV